MPNTENLNKTDLSALLKRATEKEEAPKLPPFSQVEDEAKTEHNVEQTIAKVVDSNKTVLEDTSKVISDEFDKSTGTVVNELDKQGTVLVKHGSLLTSIKEILSKQFEYQKQKDLKQEVTVQGGAFATDINAVQKESSKKQDTAGSGGGVLGNMFGALATGAAGLFAGKKLFGAKPPVGGVPPAPGAVNTRNVIRDANGRYRDTTTGRYVKAPTAAAPPTRPGMMGRVRDAFSGPSGGGIRGRLLTAATVGIGGTLGMRAFTNRNEAIRDDMYAGHSYGAEDQDPNVQPLSNVENRDSARNFEEPTQFSSSPRITDQAQKERETRTHHTEERTQTYVPVSGPTAMEPPRMDPTITALTTGGVLLGAAAITGKNAYDVIKERRANAPTPAPAPTPPVPKPKPVATAPGPRAVAVPAAVPAAAAAPNVGALSKTMGMVGKALPALGIALEGYELSTKLRDDSLSKEEKAQEVAKSGGGLAGAAAGAAIGTAILPVIGTAIGGIAGYFGGKAIAGSVSDVINEKISGTVVSDVIGRAVAVPMAAFSQDARDALMGDINRAGTKISETATAVSDKAKEGLKSAKSSVLGFFGLNKETVADKVKEKEGADSTEVSLAQVASAAQTPSPGVTSLAGVKQIESLSSVVNKEPGTSFDVDSFGIDKDLIYAVTKLQISIEDLNKTMTDKETNVVNVASTALTTVANTLANSINPLSSIFQNNSLSTIAETSFGFITDNLSKTVEVLKNSAVENYEKFNFNSVKDSVVNAVSAIKAPNVADAVLPGSPLSLIGRAVSTFMAKDKDSGVSMKDNLVESVTSSLSTLSSNVSSVFASERKELEYSSSRRERPEKSNNVVLSGAPEEITRGIYESIKKVMLVDEREPARDFPKAKQKQNVASGEVQSYKPKIEDVPSIVTDFGLVFINTGFI